MNIRKAHRIIGTIFAPFLILTGLCGALLLLRSTGLFSDDLMKLFYHLHNLTIISSYAGFVLSFGLICMACSGLYLSIKLMNLNKTKV